MRYALLRIHNNNYTLIALDEHEYDDWRIIQEGLTETVARAALKGLRDDA